MSSSPGSPADPTSGQPWEVMVERGKIAEFAEATASGNPAHRGPDALIPPTFLTTAGRWAPAGARVSVGFDRKRLLHGEQEYTFYATPPRTGDILSAQERIVDRYEKPGKRGGTMRFATVVTDFRAPDGTLIAQAKATFIETAGR
ncbi:MaoC family dehydratase N-terminal domain-containing protein [Mycobacterium sp. SMC-2]|uniref:FAS1-like dehydratase domain-containing protein n=1 Tax=Mycobacterium TaxID=1763 RepID=UPI001CE1AD4C|nr:MULTISPECIES: MaoC family dehydratase N-terminal domain-containing protein [Mycobacterium]MCA4758974.1 MaoC family dehydratase N-terminal domain-containing protein [Mycobacterium avium subsp. hominissuis]UXA06365.1 MaoC family dehydratase N-terminal domain-containing protein [Mycobacterium sp. SMC-2]